MPRALREASYGLGATKLETASNIVLPAALSGVAAAFIVAISRAVGETMIVALAAGAGPNFTFNPTNAAETMTGHIVRISGGDISYDSIDYVRSLCHRFAALPDHAHAEHCEPTDRASLPSAVPVNPTQGLFP